MRHLRFFSILAVLCVLWYPSSSLGQSAIAPRISGPVNETSLLTLHGNVSARARTEFDVGEAPSATPLSHVRLVLSRSPEQQAALDQYMADLQDKSSPNYHKWLTPDQFGKLYGPADSDIAAIVAWLESHGLKVDEVSSGRTNIAFSGTVRQVEEALHTSIHSYDANGEQFLSNTSNPVIPAALAPVVSGVAHLNTIRPRPHHVAGSLGTYDTDTRRFVSSQARVANGLNAPRPALTGGAGTSTSPYTLYMVAGDAATVYNTPNSYNAHFSGTPYTGTGVTIGIGGDAVIQAATVANYWVAFLGQTQTAAAARLTITSVDNVTSTNDIDEAYIDTQLSGALAPGAAIHYYASTDLYGAINAAVNANAVDIFSLSFGLCENFLTTSDNQTISGWWQQAAAQGMAVTVSTGDSGSAGCDNNSVASTAAYGLNVNGFASTPYNIAVGGTDFSALLAGFTTYVSTTNDSATFFRTALGPIPESTWNDSVTTNGLISANVPFLDTNGLTNIVGGSGGASSCATNSSTSSTIGTCTGGYSKPSWQRGSGVPADGVRDIPDISLMSGAGADNASWLVCTDESGPNSSGVTVTANCSNQSDGHFYFFGFGGTSTAAPAFAGMLALLQQKTGGKLGQAVSGFYDLYNGAHASAIFHDITAGNISVPCESGTPDCASNSFLTGYDTATGYDLATGIGSLDVTQLIANWGSATPAGRPTVSATPSATTISSSAAVQVAVTVTGTAGTPTGSVLLLGPSYSSASQALSAGAYTFSIPAGSLKVGANSLTVNYGGDSNYLTASSSSFTITVTGLTPTITVAPSVTSLKASDTMTVQATVSGTGTTPTGKVTLYGAGYFAAGQPLSSGTYTFNIPANSFYGGNNQSLTVSYSGDSLYAEASDSSKSISVTPVYGLFASAPSAVTAGATGSSTVTVYSSSGYAGTVTLSCALASSPSGATALPTCSVGAPVSLTANSTSGTATVSIGTTTRAALERPRIFPWEGAGGGAVLALVIFLVTPARRRRWLSMLGMFVAMMAIGSMVACGGGGSSGGGGGGGTGTTAGTYKFTVTGTGSPALTPSPTATITITVN
jgi:Pro-kumamolisin, activation domain/Bacterial Ig-like domain (group 3)